MTATSSSTASGYTPSFDSSQPLPAVSPVAVFVALLRRDMLVARKEIVFFLVRTIMQPLLFLVVFGYLLPKMSFVGKGYQTALLPGILAVSLSLAAIQSVALPMVQDFGWTKEIEDRLLAPVPTQLIAAEKIVAGMIQGVIAATVRAAGCANRDGPDLRAHTHARRASAGCRPSRRGSVLGARHVARHRDRAAADRLDVQRHRRADAVLRLRVLSMARARRRAGDEVPGARESDGVRRGRDARRADAVGAAHAASASSSAR